MPTSDPASDLHLTFCGHQTWHISTDAATVLLDPILTPAFGAGSVDFRIWPPREIHGAGMPAPDAVILSHEHLDHLHLPSLDQLDRSVPIYLGVTVPAAVADALTCLGFGVVRVDYSHPVQVGDLEIYLYPASARTLFWESRVAQPLIRRTGAQAGADGDVFIAVDADISDLYREQLDRGELAPPRMAIVSNNAQTVPYGALGADHNLLPGMDGPRHRSTGLEILNFLLIDYLRPLDGVRDVALCGNGHIGPRSPHGCYMYADHQALAAHANELQHLFTVHGPRPGDRLTVPADAGEVRTSRVPWISIDGAAERRGTQKLADFRAAPYQASPAPITEPLAGDEVAAACRNVDAELPRLARDLLTTRTGALAVGLHDYLDGPLGGGRLVLRLLDPPRRPDIAETTAETWVWDITGPSFRPVPTTSLGDAMSAYPFGIELYFADFARLFTGEVQIWDIISASYQGWHIGEPLDSPVYALTAIYGEHQRPDLAAAVYRRHLRQLGALPAGPEPDEETTGGDPDGDDCEPDVAAREPGRPVTA